eukprot:CCRYP_010284-RA/>CCRYP_010284-RA protein AED:0.01 eAED:0.01 QI:44/1/1/1/1/1/2/1410/698
MAEPHTPLLKEVISSLRNATTCRSCQRYPLHLSSPHDLCQNNVNGIGGQHDRIESDSASDCYDGPLMASTSCGCLFCRDCYASASIVAIDNLNTNNVSHAEMHGSMTLLTHETKCPVCRNPCIGHPRPIIPWLANEYRSLPLPFVCEGDVMTPDIESSLRTLNTLLELLNPQIDIDEDVDKGVNSDHNWVGREILEDEKHSNKIVESPPQEVNVPCPNVMSKSWNDDSLIKVDESEVPGTCLSILQQGEASETLSIGGCQQTNNGEKQTKLSLEMEASNDDTKRTESSLACEPSKLIRPPTEVEHDHRNGSEIIPGTCGDFQQSSEVFGHTEEVPGTHLSFLSRRRISRVRNEDCNSEMHDVPMKFNHVPSTLPPCSEPCNGQTEEVPGTYLSFLDKRRISPAGNELSFPQMHRDENCYSDLGDKGSLLPCSLMKKTHTCVNEDRSPQGDVIEMETENVDRRMPSRMQSQIEPCDDAHTEDVPGTILSFLDRNKMPHVEDKPQSMHSLETRDRKVSLNTKRRRVSASPQLKLPDKKKKTDVRVDAVVSKVDSESNIQSPIMCGTGSRERHSDNLIVKPKDIIEKEACSSKKLRDTALKSDNSFESTIDKDKNSVSVHATMTNKQLCIAYDILDHIETNALEWLNERTLCIVVDGVHRVPSNHKNVFMPFPSILVTHAVEKSGLSPNDNEVNFARQPPV